MEQVVSAQNIIDEGELKAFDTYTWRNKHMLDKSGIPNYEKNFRPLNYNYFENERKSHVSSSKKRVTPLISSDSYQGFNNSA